MLKTLHGKLVLALCALLLLVALLLMPLTLLITRISQQEFNQRLNRELAANVVAEKILVQHGQVSVREMDRVLDALDRLNPGTEAYILDPSGVVLAYPSSQSKIALARVDVKPIQSFLHREQLPILGENPLIADDREVFSAAPLISKGRFEGYLYILLDSPEYESVAALVSRNYALQLRLIVIAAVLLCAFGMGLVLFSHMTRRLTGLAQAMDNFEKSDFRGGTAIPIADPNGDEIDRLGAIFAGMAGRIEQQIEELRQADALRRELVSNASHDLRTPLAALRGYLETLMLREGRMTPEEQRAYLKIAIKHGERLSTLVEELFELAKLDALQIEPRTEPFLLEELLQDVAQKYHLIAENKGVSLRTTSNAASGGFFVCADIALIERVLENLIENALRHTPSGGSITLKLTPHEGRVRVQVIDTGSGIAPADLPRIFDRFYRAVPSDDVPTAAHGAGLGLAIARRILELHGSSISVQSEPGQGATFTFDLPVAALD